MRNSLKPMNIKHKYSPYILTNDRFQPGACADCAGIDPDYDTFTDDELEIRNGLYRHAIAHGEGVNG